MNKSNLILERLQNITEGDLSNQKFEAKLVKMFRAEQNNSSGVSWDIPITVLDSEDVIAIQISEVKSGWELNKIDGDRIGVLFGAKKNEIVLPPSDEVINAISDIIKKVKLISDGKKIAKIALKILKGVSLKSEN